jgi:hypothetical protein
VSSFGLNTISEDDRLSQKVILNMFINVLGLLNALDLSFFEVDAQPNGGRRTATLPPPHPKSKFKKIVDMMISNVLRDLPFSRNQHLKSADDYFIGILKNKMKNLESLR